MLTVNFIYFKRSKVNFNSVVKCLELISIVKHNLVLLPFCDKDKIINMTRAWDKDSFIINILGWLIFVLEFLWVTFLRVTVKMFQFFRLFLAVLRWAAYALETLHKYCLDIPLPPHSFSLWMYVIMMAIKCFSEYYLLSVSFPLSGVLLLV